MRARGCGRWIGVGLIALSMACGRGEQKRFGQPCSNDDQCASSLCVGGAGQATPFCSKSCATSTECPNGYSCSGSTARGVVVCVRGGPTPFLPSAR